MNSSMYSCEKIEFQTRDNIKCRGYLYLPCTSELSIPFIIMTPGFSALKEQGLKPFAQLFVEHGMGVLLYDHRNFGESEGTPRLEVDPFLQVRDMSDAITYLQGLKQIHVDRIGLWGTSFSAGHVLVLAAADKRVSSLVAQVPFVEGHHVAVKKERPDIWNILIKKYEMDARAREKGCSPAMISVVAKDPQKSAIMKQSSAYDFFMNEPLWKNEVTLRSIENSGNYSPMDYIKDIHSIPSLFIIADQDTICLTKLALSAYEKIRTSKKCVMIPGDHFAPYEKEFSVCAKEACEWFMKTLCHNT